MARKKTGSRGRVVIPKHMRDAIGLKPGVEVVLAVRGDDVGISKPKAEGNYTDYYTATYTPKLRKSVDIKEIIQSKYR
jgi:AbrB family looped-hinge helix DNA binding protein